MSEYGIFQVDGEEEADVIRDLHKICFPGEPPYSTAEGYWWIAINKAGLEVAFAGLKHGERNPKKRGYLCRSGVLPGHRGHGLQKALITVRLRKARSLGMTEVVTDTRYNPHSANNLIARGFQLYEPDMHWALSGALYWRRFL